MTRPSHVIVVGGGIAGIAASLVLARRGLRVTLLEARRRLGGRASSFVDAATGELLDNGQHVTMGCCHEYERLLAMLDMRDSVQWFDEQVWIEPGGRRSTIAPHPLLAWLPGPAAFGPSLLGVRFLSWADKVRIATALSEMLLLDRRDFMSVTFAQWLASQGQSPEALARFWEPIIVSACNLSSHEVAASCAMHVFQDGLAGGVEAARVGVSRVPLGALYANVGAALAASGGDVLFGATATRLGLRSVETTRGTFEADAVICALPPEKVCGVVDPSLLAGDTRFDALASVAHSPIVCAHVELAQGRIDVAHAVLLDGICQWVFRKDASGQRLSVVISAAESVVQKTDGELAGIIERELAERFPQDRAGDVLRVARCRAVRERFATFRATPAWEQRRPTTLGPRGLGGVVLAGDYVATGWPATMESATRAGFAAAGAVFGSH